MTSTRHGLTLVELVVSIFIIVVLVALLLPAQRDVRAAARRSQCKVNLKQIGLAIHNYHETYQVLPAGWTSGDYFAWSSRILPNLDQAPLYSALDFGREWMADPKTPQTQLPVFRCPSDLGKAHVEAPVLRVPVARSNYIGVSGATPISSNPVRVSETFGAFGEDSYRRFHDFKDGLSVSILVGERIAPGRNAKNPGGDAIWIGARDENTAQGQALVIGDCAPDDPPNWKLASEQAIAGGNLTGFSSEHTGGTQFLIADGSARFVSERIDPKIYGRLATIDDGAAVGDF